MRRRKKRATLLRRLLEEVRNFLDYYEGRTEGKAALEKAIAERIVQFSTPPRTKFHEKVVEILRAYFPIKEKGTKLLKARVEYAHKDGGERPMPKKVCAVCGVEAEDVFEFTQGPRILGTADKLLKSDEVPKVLVVDVPVTRLCAYCADTMGVKHPDEKVAEGVRYYTDLMKHAVPKLQEHIVPASEGHKKDVDVEKVREALFVLQDAVTKLARKMEELGEGGRQPEKLESGLNYPEEPDEVADAWREDED